LGLGVVIAQFREALAGFRGFRGVSVNGRLIVSDILLVRLDVRLIGSNILLVRLNVL
jgi:hypothetical protein